MAVPTVPFDQHLAEEVKKYNGVAFVVKASWFECLTKNYALCKTLHPNPADEFTMPRIGPSYRIISEYESKFRSLSTAYIRDEDPIIIEKMHPDGYMIINGHHRWAAYYRLGIDPVHVKLVNLTHNSDIKEMLQHAEHDKRVTLDLDEVVFADGEEEELEKKPVSFFKNAYPERIRKGIPALFHHFSKAGYDIWVYTAQYYSMDYIKKLFKKYHVDINGIVTGTGKKTSEDLQAKKDIEGLIARKYKYTLHVDKDMVLRINNETKDFEEYKIDLEKSNWSQGIMDIIGALNGEEEK